MEIIYLTMPMKTLVEQTAKTIKPQNGSVYKYNYFFEPVKDVVIFELFVKEKEDQ